MFWGIVEKITGVNRHTIKELLKCRAADFLESTMCVCGHGPWMHEPNSHCRECARYAASATCKQFQARSDRSGRPETIDVKESHE
jgi:hypothetical protein